MDRSRQELLAIGGFARATLLSVKALCLYDQLGVLTPAYIDPASGYRYYRVEQLRDARLIRAMRQVGLPLATIRQALATSPAEAEPLLYDYLRALEARVAQARRTVPELIVALHKEETQMSPEVNIRTVDRQPIVSVTYRVTVGGLDQRIKESLDALFSYVEEQGGAVAGSPFGLYHGPINGEEDGPIEVCVPVDRALPAAGEIMARVLAGGRLAYVVLYGEECVFPTVLKGYDAVYDWIAHNGYEAEDAPREVWRSRPEDRQAEMEVAWRFRAIADAQAPS